MAKLNFQWDLDMSTDISNPPPIGGYFLGIIHEPDHDLTQYVLNDAYLNVNKMGTLPNHDYPSVTFQTCENLLTARRLSRLGVKAYPSIGSIAFFKYKYAGNSFILAPVHNKQRHFSKPVLSMEQDTDTLTFTITPPTDITYLAYKVFLRNDEFTIEYTTYENILVVPKPDVKGTYDIYCIGYVNEGENTSFDSNLLHLSITKGQDSFAPKANMSYYTKEQIDEMLGDVSVLLDKLNGVVI